MNEQADADNRAFYKGLIGWITEEYLQRLIVYRAAEWKLSVKTIKIHDFGQPPVQACPGMSRLSSCSSRGS